LYPAVMAVPDPDDLPPKDPADMSADELRAELAGVTEALVGALDRERAWSLRAAKGHGCIGRYCGCLDGEVAAHVRKLEGWPGWPLPRMN
jgi:hypothetical protein